jgi:BirA family transcriptional regulator, biotin operon repressor / biotin---[acetyl-CoA-carboxylase] ligase
LKTKILSLLKESDSYLSGQELCNKFNVSRTAIWKVINQLKDEGYVIEAVQNRGYHLVDYPDLITYSEIKSVLTTKWAGEKLYYFDSLDSTNTKAKQLAEEGAPHGTLLIANQQTGGKGRRGRTWESPANTGIWMTLILKPHMNPTHASMLTLVMALAITKACNEITNATCAIKWPNDIVLNRKKICGILTEMSAEMDYINHIVIGIGINANTDEFPEELIEKATSIKKENGEKIKRAQLINKVLLYFEEEYRLFMKNENLSLQMDNYNNLLVNRGKEVVVIEPSNQYSGIAHGINQNGELLVEKPDGQVVQVYAGEVSIRGIYGYV